MAAPEFSPQQHAPVWHRALLIAGLGFVLIFGCFGAGFLTYDDPVHVLRNAQLSEGAQLEDMLAPVNNSTYFPVTLFSYRIDQMLFQSWMPGVLGSWAPGVRLMNCVYHAAAALILWRMLLLLGLSANEALFVAVVFAAHPLACETVCWASERKNTLSALFGFGALWAFLKLGAEKTAKAQLLRMAATAGLYVLALLSKPSALGLFPVLLVFEAFDAPRGLEKNAPMQWRPSRGWLSIALRMAPLALISLLVTLVNVSGHVRTLLPPPGGSIFTAGLTDLEILARYLFSLVAPVALSASYYVKPVASLGDARVCVYGALLAVVVWGSTRVAANPRRALLGWMWFLGALGPSLNFIAITSLMNDRYLYLSLPGFFIVVIEVAAGIGQRVRLPERTVRLGACAFVALLATLGLVRGTVWNSTFEVFQDAVQKQPESSFAQNGLGIAYAQAWHALTKSKGVDTLHQGPEFHRQWIEHWRFSINCPDADRNLFLSLMSNRVGEDDAAAGRAADAEHYWTLGAYPPPNRPDEPDARAKCLSHLSVLRLAEGKAGEAFQKAEEAIAAYPCDVALLARSHSALALLKEKRAAGDEESAQRLLSKARRDLEAIKSSSKLYADARTALANPIFNSGAPRN